MDMIQVICLAIIQGISEFLPVSSSAHLILPSRLLGWSDQGLAFDVAVHVGSLLAVLIYFRHDLNLLLVAWCKSLSPGHSSSAESQMAWFIIIATIPAGIMGFLFAEPIEAHLRSIAVIACTTMLFGLLLGWVDLRCGGSKGMGQMTWRSALFVGLAQALALIPGTSRSGITITAALALGFDRRAAARFSFLLAIPAILLSGGYKGLQLLNQQTQAWFDIILGLCLSAITAYLCIHGFLRFIDRIGMLPFVIYRLVLGAVLMFFYWGWL